MKTMSLKEAIKLLNEVPMVLVDDRFFEPNVAKIDNLFNCKTFVNVDFDRSNVSFDVDDDVFMFLIREDDFEPTFCFSARNNQVIEYNEDFLILKDQNGEEQTIRLLNYQTINLEEK
jgi:hypothetical protein